MSYYVYQMRVIKSFMVKINMHGYIPVLINPLKFLATEEEKFTDFMVGNWRYFLE